MRVLKDVLLRLNAAVGHRWPFAGLGGRELLSRVPPRRRRSKAPLGPRIFLGEARTACTREGTLREAESLFAGNVGSTLPAHRRCSREVLSPHVPRTDLEPPARTFLPPTGADVHSHHAAPSTASACRHTRPPIRSPGCWPHQPFYCPTAECIRPTRWTPPKRRRPPDHTLFARKRQIPAYANGTASAPLIRRTEWGSAAPRWRKARE
jgi:hypothetical protein